MKDTLITSILFIVIFIQLGIWRSNYIEIEYQKDKVEFQKCMKLKAIEKIEMIQSLSFRKIPNYSCGFVEKQDFIPNLFK